MGHVGMAKNGKSWECMGMVRNVEGVTGNGKDSPMQGFNADAWGPAETSSSLYLPLY